MIRQQSKAKKLLQMLFSAVTVLFGNAMYAFAVIVFIRPSNMVMGGVTGISLVVQKYIPTLEISYFILAGNVILFIIGAIVLGKHFIVTTAASTVLYPMFVYIFERVLKNFDIQKFLPVEANRLLYSLVAGLIIGVGVGVLVRSGASTGGSDIPPLVFNKLFGLPLGPGMLIVDGAIILAQFLVSWDLASVLYGVIMVITYSFVVNQLSIAGSEKVEIMVMSDQYDEIRATVMSELGRGITLLSARKGMTGEHSKMLMTVISSRQLARVKKIVLSTDPTAFMVITRVSEVNGNGFSFSKGDRKLDKEELLR